MHDRYSYLKKIKGSELGRITHTHKPYGTVGLIFLCSKKATGMDILITMLTFIDFLHRYTIAWDLIM